MPWHFKGQRVIFLTWLLDYIHLLKDVSRAFYPADSGHLYTANDKKAPL